MHVAVRKAVSGWSSTSSLECVTDHLSATLAADVHFAPCAGIDLNPRFHDCAAYEFTDEVAIFDLLQVKLLHGWLVDPQVAAETSASFPIGAMSQLWICQRAQCHGFGFVKQPSHHASMACARLHCTCS